ncbi:PREDICTED: uncharacterized protein LOC109582668 [Amphimedon queenslandica]|uniref:Helicase ATP-binding domain-containing protein n=1 Tax=Amphimedon queenslandica TaxID=400682 RepID=A0AAN0J8N3_AMPQE|nr:PREDICTED: uncharacterized protein LOC109582668 [Amphimedon queenslandica]|eukprot:XP_019853068.1 PREDICTED: uncharacterized protein LOC109582668 [Amphimedon queenslandica]
MLGSQRVLVLTPSNAISEQIFKAFGGQEPQDMFFVQREIITKDTTDDVRPSCTLITSTDQIKNSLHNELLIITAHQVAGSSRVRIQDISPENYDLVIVDEAHHYPAPTWRTIVNHFSGSKRLFLTATPYHRSTQGYILKDIEAHLAGLDGNVPVSIEKYYNLSLRKAIDDGVIREKEFHEVGTSAEFVDQLDAMQEVSIKIIQILREHDTQDPSVKHQAMVLTQSAEDFAINSARDFFHEYNQVAPPGYHCEIYVAGSPTSVLTEFQNGATRTLVIVNKLREGYDNTNVSVAAIVRNVQPKSRVYFLNLLAEQFVRLILMILLLQL